MSSETLNHKFDELKKKNLPALLTYTVAGDPSKDISLEIFKSIADSGADIIEYVSGFLTSTRDSLPVACQMVM